MKERKDKGGILGFGILGGNRPKLLEKTSSGVVGRGPGFPLSAEEQFCSLLKEMVEDERKAPGGYMDIIGAINDMPTHKRAMLSTEKNTLEKIVEDERRHFNWVSMMYNQYCVTPERLKLQRCK